MYRHHEESLEIMRRYFEEKPEVIALIFGGSVAKGNERPDSDLDAMVVIEDAAYEERVHTRTAVETISGLCTYEGGYFDVKYMTKDYLRAAADHASEPTRNAFVGCRVLFSRDPEIEGIVARIPVFQEREREEKMLSFYADFSLNYHYFLKGCKPDGYMLLHAVGEVIYSVYRMALQEHGVLFPCNRRLEETVAKLSPETAELARLGRALAESQSMEDCDRFVACFQRLTSWRPPEDYSEVLTAYTRDFEQWWMSPRPNINEW